MANEKRLIDANAEIRKMKDVLSKMKTDERSLAVEIIIAGLERTTTVDAVEVVHGRWVMTLYTTTSKRGRVISNQKFACSVCGYGNGRKQSNYCPNCGAKMDGKRREGK